MNLSENFHTEHFRTERKRFQVFAKTHEFIYKEAIRIMQSTLNNRITRIAKPSKCWKTWSLCSHPVGFNQTQEENLQVRSGRPTEKLLGSIELTSCQTQADTDRSSVIAWKTQTDQLICTKENWMPSNGWHIWNPNFGFIGTSNLEAFK